jgi:hypothetical protein
MVSRQGRRRRGDAELLFEKLHQERKLPAGGARLAVAGVERHHPPVHAFAQRVEAQHLPAALDRSLHLFTGDEMVEQRSWPRM